MDFDAVRAEFPALERVAYLNTGTFGPVPQRSHDAAAAWSERELREGRSGVDYFDHRLEQREQVRAMLADLLGAGSHQVALTRSTTESCNIVLAGLGLAADEEIVTTDLEHFGLLGALGASGARVRVARLLGRPPGEAVESIRREIGSRTRLVATSHVSWLNGQVLPIADIAELGVPVLVDGAQSVGAIPVDLGELSCDFYTFPGQKWLLGPDGTGGLALSDAWLERLAVCLPSYYGQQDYTDDGRWTPAEGAARFDPGTIPAAAIAGWAVALELAAELGEERFGHGVEMAARCHRRLSSIVALHSRSGDSTLVAFEPRGNAEDVVRELSEQGVIVRSLPRLGWVRASVGFWNNDSDLARLARGLTA
ncbi:MAG: aminotransferase class V-fold PLP-dependent enzyme [Actinomycetia bacterium]|nr:aminotransferase class V-fold PLP-dependent enzyme [Actinomycetes bacterium]